MNLNERIEEIKQFDLQLKKLLASNKLIEIINRMNSFYALHPDAKDILTIIQSHNKALEIIKKHQEIIKIAKIALGNIKDENDNSYDDEQASCESYFLADKVLGKIKEMEEND